MLLQERLLNMQVERSACGFWEQVHFNQSVAQFSNLRQSALFDRYLSSFFVHLVLVSFPLCSFFSFLLSVLSFLLRLDCFAIADRTLCLDGNNFVFDVFVVLDSTVWFFSRCVPWFQLCIRALKSFFLRQSAVFACSVCDSVVLDVPFVDFWPCVQSNHAVTLVRLPNHLRWQLERNYEANTQQHRTKHLRNSRRSPKIMWKSIQMPWLQMISMLWHCSNRLASELVQNNNWKFKLWQKFNSADSNCPDLLFCNTNSLLNTQTDWW